MGDLSYIETFKLTWKRVNENLDTVTDAKEEAKLRKIIKLVKTLDEIPSALLAELEKLIPSPHKMSDVEQQAIQHYLDDTGLEFAGVHVNETGICYTVRNSPSKLGDVEHDLNRIFSGMEDQFLFSGEVIVISTEDTSYSQKFCIADSEMSVQYPQGILWG